MGLIDNLSQSQLGDIFRRLRALESASPMNSGAVGSGGFEVYDGGVITISNGGLNITGTATITGTLSVGGTTALTGPFSQSGTSTFTGTTNLNGPTNVAGNFTATGDTKLNGPTHVNGNTDVTGTFTVNGAMRTTSTLSVEGVTTLKNDLNVTTGKIKAGGVTIDPSLYSGSVRFSNGSYVAATPNGAQMVQGSGAVTVSTSQADIGVAGGGSVIANLNGVYLGGLPTTASKPNLYIDPATNRVFRSTAVF